MEQKYFVTYAYFDSTTNAVQTGSLIVSITDLVSIDDVTTAVKTELGITKTVSIKSMTNISPIMGE